MRSNVNDFLACQATFARAKLVCPPIPIDLAVDLEKHSAFVFASHGLQAAPYDFEKYLVRARQPATGDSIVLGHDGHGVNSYAISYFLTWRSLSLVLQLGWGGVYMDEEVSTRRVNEVFGGLHDLWPKVERRLAEPCPRIVIAHSTFHGGCSYLNEAEISRWDAGGQGRSPVLVALDSILG